MSALPPKADIETQSRDVRFVPKANPRRASEFSRGLSGEFFSLGRGTNSRPLIYVKRRTWDGDFPQRNHSVLPAVRRPLNCSAQQRARVFLIVPGK